ncbi:uncharacterized protein BT62DRAFT_942611 [Guyanagaster necrorhizus]|uniref:F-box domain-containing protein n=1 Tax=Guyanagaster necrorhizus TaxID=856835 RepID=A0A9P8AXU9_9AGAR|nr:uncharacterized protein BT62DRAFT_942611 [Guyanagaster necrorhizus MCA 3950]KAG7451596.1 hypothetical protein BT62DRAFT_942611 [Guyanagaster necrorhizus MCA 3950]
MHFLDLPLDILPLILSHLQNTHHLALTCCVNKIFYQFAAPRLYERISIYSWHKHRKTKVLQLFGTLSRYPHLARYVRRLGQDVLRFGHDLSYSLVEIRDFPKALPHDGINILEVVISAVRNCTNLRSCTWTRDGSLSSEILEAFLCSTELHELEINGHNDGNYDASILRSFSNLRRISLIMPSSSVVAMLPSWMSVTGNSLHSLTLICKSSPIITDTVLESMAADLQSLQYFYITGCPKVSHRGIWSILSVNPPIHGLGLEGLSSKFNMHELARLCSQSPILHQLRSITLTINRQIPLQTWMQDVLQLLAFSPLEVFQIYSTGAFFESPMTYDFWREIVNAHGTRLTRFSVHRMLVGLEPIEDICRRCPNLEQLFIVIEQGSLVTLQSFLPMVPKLQALHINYPVEAHTASLPVLLPSEALQIVQHCSSSLTQIGCNAEVWQVRRSIEIDSSGRLHTRRFLAKYESPDIPEPFLVVRI